MSIPNDILNRLKKLDALTASTNVNEAAVAATKLQEMLLKHNIEVWEAEEETPKYGFQKFDYSAGGVTRSKVWKQQLLTTIARSTSCSVVCITGSEKAGVFGTKLGITTCRHLYAYLIHEILGLEELKWSESNGSCVRTVFATSFYAGAVDTIHMRLSEQTNKTTAESSSALVYIKQTEEDLAKLVSEYFGKTTSKKSAAFKVNAHAYKAGKRAASSINLAHQIGAAENTAQGTAALQTGD